jgi:hypothetical protein
MDFSSLMARSMAASAGKKRCIRERPALRPQAAPRGVRLPGRARQPEPAKPHRQLRLLERPQPPRVAASVSLGPTSRLGQVRLFARGWKTLGRTCRQTCPAVPPPACPPPRKLVGQVRMFCGKARRQVCGARLSRR